VRRCLPAVLLVLALGAACSNEPEATRDDTGAVATEGAVDAFDIKVGDCFNEPEGGASEEEQQQIASISAVPCDQPHDGEVYHDFELPDGDYPGNDAVLEASAEECVGAFEGFVGTAYEESALDIYPITPTQESWDQADDRAVSCVVFDPQGQATGSLAGAGR
jgi:hypothetical protein